MKIIIFSLCLLACCTHTYSLDNVQLSNEVPDFCETHLKGSQLARYLNGTQISRIRYLNSLCLLHQFTFSADITRNQKISLLWQAMNHHKSNNKQIQMIEHSLEMLSPVEFIPQFIQSFKKEASKKKVILLRLIIQSMNYSKNVMIKKSKSFDRADAPNKVDKNLHLARKFIMEISKNSQENATVLTYLFNQLPSIDLSAEQSLITLNAILEYPKLKASLPNSEIFKQKILIALSGQHTQEKFLPEVLKEGQKLKGLKQYHFNKTLCFWVAKKSQSTLSVNAKMILKKYLETIDVYDAPYGVISDLPLDWLFAYANISTDNPSNRMQFIVNYIEQQQVATQIQLLESGLSSKEITLILPQLKHDTIEKMSTKLELITKTEKNNIQLLKYHLLLGLLRNAAIKHN